MLNVKIVKATYDKELQNKVNEAFDELQNLGYKIIDTDVAGRASDSGYEWIMTIVYDDNLS